MQKVSQDIRLSLASWLEESIRRYVAKMDKRNNGHLHDLIIGGVEKPLLEIVLKETHGNQTEAATILGINRNTLRKKIKDYKIQC